MKKKIQTGEKRSINFRELSFASDPLSTEKSMMDVIPMQWPKEVSSGSRKVNMTYPTK